MAGSLRKERWRYDDEKVSCWIMEFARHWMTGYYKDSSKLAYFWQKDSSLAKKRFSRFFTEYSCGNVLNKYPICCGFNILINTHKIIWYDFGGTKVRGYGGTRIDFSRNIGRADYSRTSAPPPHLRIIPSYYLTITKRNWNNENNWLAPQEILFSLFQFQIRTDTISFK